MKELTNHKMSAGPHELVVTATDKPGPGGAHHVYSVYHPCFHSPLFLQFQQGTIPRVGVNGITHESLLAILEDRLSAFQEGTYACWENEMALMHIRMAMQLLVARTKRRIKAGIEGEHSNVG